MRNFYKIGFFILLLLLIGGGAFYFGNNYTNLFPTPSPTPSPTPYIFPTEIVSPTKTVKSLPLPTTKPSLIKSELKANIKDALTSKNYAALEGYMTDKVGVVLEASECCGQLSKSDAIKQLDYLNNATPPWNFDDSNPIAASLRNNNPTNYGPADSIIGIAANDYVAVFKLNSENRIMGITMAVTYKLVVP